MDNISTYTKKISIIIPAFNEEENVSLISQLLIQQLNHLKYDFEILFIDDGSTDRTLEALKVLNEKDNRLKYLSLSRNFGHQHALKAGIDYAEGDAVISMDCDMQHPPELILEMLTYWEQGYEVVYTQRKEDKRLPLFKRMSAKLFYKLIGLISDANIEQGTSDFRLLDKKIIETFRSLPENDTFFRGLIKWTGFKQFKIIYSPNERNKGTSKYSLKKMLSLAISGITSSTIFPLRMATVSGFVVSGVAFIYSLFVLYDYFFTTKNLLGWTTIILAILFIGGVQLISIGIIGEYIGKILKQVKGRPQYIIYKSSNNETKKDTSKL